MSTAREQLYRFIAPLLLLVASSSRAETAPVSTAAVFERYSKQVVQVRILERSTRTKSVIGSGFYVDGEGRIITNYHVVAKLVNEPDRYVAEARDSEGRDAPATLAFVDVVNDLALIRVADSSPAYFELGSEARTQQGARLFALGNPRDLGLTIVEGTYNGLIRPSLNPKIHFTGSLNPGMSGGPAITEDGRVAGVNVQTQGNQISLLVPVTHAVRLLRSAKEPRRRKSFLDLARDQILHHQRETSEMLLERGFKEAALGPYRVPSMDSETLRCWSNVDSPGVGRFTQYNHGCSFDDGIYLDDGFVTGTVDFHHVYLQSRGLNRFQFYELLENRLSRHDNELADSEKFYTNYSCRRETVDFKGAPFAVSICMRGHRKLEGLYDLIVLLASLDRNIEGLISHLTVSGIGFDEAKRFTERYLGSFR